MINRIFFLLIGFGLTVIGFMYVIAYSNLMTIGYDYSDYIKFIFSRFECMLSIIGLIIITITIYLKGEKTDDKRI